MLPDLGTLLVARRSSVRRRIGGLRQSAQGLSHDPRRNVRQGRRDRDSTPGRKTVTLTVANTGDRPIQVGSHYHFFETNPALKFDRKKARGMRLDIAAGTAVRFEPGQTREVTLVALAGERTVYGFRQRRDGEALKGDARCRSPCKRAAYADMFGPTTGDRVRLADTDLIIEVEKDFTTYGEEVKFGGGKVIRDGMGQSAGHQQAGRRRHRHHQRADPRPLGHRQSRRRHQGRPHRRDRQGRQSRHPARRDHRHRPRHRGHRRRRQDPHRRRLRHPHPFHLPAAGRRGADVRRHLDARRRHRPGAPAPTPPPARRARGTSRA